MAKVAAPRRRRLSVVARWLATLVALLVTGVWLGGRSWLHSSLPRLDGEVRLPGLRAAVEVMRDRRGVPSIAATSEVDAFFALGYVHAQDRFLQMEMLRRTVSGRLSELVGEHALSLDKRMRQLGMRPAAEHSFSALRPATQAALTAYAAGVNAWLSDSGQRQPAELDVLRLRGAPARPDPWVPADSIGILKFFSLLLDGNYNEELRRGSLIARLGVARAHIFEHPPPLWGDSTDILPEPDTVAPATPPPATPRPSPEHGERAPIGDVEHDLEALVQVLGGGIGIGSNSWVISGARTRSGYPLLSNDPHLAVQSPSQWYAARITAPGLAVSGASSAHFDDLLEAWKRSEPPPLDPPERGGESRLRLVAR
jgi:penicillin amidase